MERTRLDDMLERYGEVCTQKVAAQLLNVVPRTIHRMLEEGRLRRVDRRVDVRSICEYIENPKQANFVAKAKNTRPRNTVGSLCAGGAFPLRRTSISHGFWMKPIRRTANWGCLWAGCC